MTRRFILDLWADCRGSAAVEMMLMMPLLTVLMFGGLEGAHYLYMEHQIVKGVRDGARYASRRAFSAYNCGASSVTTAVRDDVRNVTRFGKVTVTGSDKPRIYTWADTDTSVTVSCPATAVTTGLYANMSNAPTVTVSANVLYPSLFGRIGGLGTTMRVYARDQSAVVGL